MHILFLPTWYPTDWDVAAGVFTQQSIKAHKRAGFKVGVIYVDVNYKNFQRIPFRLLFKKLYKLEDDIPTFRYYGVGLPNFNAHFLSWNLRQVEKLYMEYEKQFGKPDIIHAHVFMMGYAALQLKKKYGIPYVVTEHLTAFPLEAIPAKYNSIISEVLNQSSASIAVSNFLKQHMQRYTNKNIYNLFNIIDIDLFTLKSKFGIDNKTVKILCIGDLIPKKNFSFLINACQQIVYKYGISNFIIDIIGYGYAEKQLKEQVYRLKLNNYFSFLGSQNHNKIASFIKQSDFFVSVSTIETCGVAILEAMSVGVPIIATNVGSLPELIDDEKGILVPLNDIDAFCKAFIYMINNFSIYNAQKIRDFVILNASDTSVIGRLSQIYKAITNE